MQRVLSALDELAVWLAAFEPRWWVWPSTLVAVAVLSLAASWTLHPGADEFVYFPGGTRFGDTCAFIVVTGQPCPQCGMTRSWVHAVRGDLFTSFWYSPAGLGLFLWIQVAGVIGLVRLVRRDRGAWAPPWQFNVGWATFWLIGLYAGPWILRLFGVNPLP